VIREFHAVVFFNEARSPYKPARQPHGCGAGTSNDDIAELCTIHKVHTFVIYINHSRLDLILVVH
jgi:hypothetical protein